MRLFSLIGGICLEMRNMLQCPTCNLLSLEEIEQWYINGKGTRHPGPGRVAVFSPFSFLFPYCPSNPEVGIQTLCLNYPLKSVNATPDQKSFYTKPPVNVFKRLQQVKLVFRLKTQSIIFLKSVILCLSNPHSGNFMQSSNNWQTSLHHQADLVMTLDKSFQQLTSAQQVIHRPHLIRAARSQCSESCCVFTSWRKKRQTPTGDDVWETKPEVCLMITR